MGKFIVILAEKPAVARSIANIVGAGERHIDKNGRSGYLEGNGYRVTWAFGHVIRLKRPEDVGFKGDVLPIMPENWETEIVSSGNAEKDAILAKQVENYAKLFKEASYLIEATDSAREGELIFRYVYEYLGIGVPFRRLWISSLTDEAITKGMDDLRPGEELDLLSDAAHARSEADWLVGYNASRALRVSTGMKGSPSMGRVQTPVLCMICERYDKNKNFVPTPFWQVQALVHKDMDNFAVLSALKYTTEAAAKEAADRASETRRMRVTKVEKKQVVTKPPLLFDLTSLQRAANGRLGLSASETLDIAQKLYESKYLTYPRTGSRYISEDVFRTIPSLLKKIQGYDRFSAAAADLEGKKLCRKSVDDTKIADHHALLPTPVIPTGLTGNHLKIWEMVCARTLEAFGEDSLSDRTTAEFDCNGTAFKATGSVLKKAGWKSVLGAQAADEDKREGKDDDEPQTRLPELVEGEVLPATKIETLKKTDKPLPLYTDGTLLAEMETCGKHIEDEELRESLKEVGLGTPATRAATIEREIAAGYVERKDKKLIPTERGLGLWKMVRHMKISDVRTSAEWERDLGKVEKGLIPKAQFDEGIRKFTLEVIEDIREHSVPMSGLSATSEPSRTCPLCGRPMKNMKFSILCDDKDGGCGLHIPREICGKKLPASALEALASGKRTALIKGFKSKAGKEFQAQLEIDHESRKVTWVTEKRPEMTGRTCPHCGETLQDTPWRLTCGCGFNLYKSTGGVNLTPEQVDTLLKGGTLSLKGLKSKEGKKYDAKVSANAETGKFEYQFDKKKR